jgi:guanosine-3',5'-bis(diphosphate) 3'-pyrophosphohydrolase
MNEDEMGRFLEAIVYAAKQHKGQMRKDGETPYINHPLEVAEVLWRVGEVRDEVLLTAAILHDTVEDTDSTEAELRSLFGDEVTDVVMEVTDNKLLPKKVRKMLQVKQVASKSKRARQLKLADKYCNVHDIQRKPPAKWGNQRKLEYLEWSEKVMDGARGVNDALETLLEDEIRLGRRRLEDEQGADS